MLLSPRASFTTSGNPYIWNPSAMDVLDSCVVCVQFYEVKLENRQTQKLFFTWLVWLVRELAWHSNLVRCRIRMSFNKTSSLYVRLFSHRFDWQTALALFVSWRCWCSCHSILCRIKLQKLSCLFRVTALAFLIGFLLSPNLKLTSWMTRCLLEHLSETCGCFLTNCVPHSWHCDPWRGTPCWCFFCHGFQFEPTWTSAFDASWFHKPCLFMFCSSRSTRERK